MPEKTRVDFRGAPAGAWTDLCPVRRFRKSVGCGGSIPNAMRRCLLLCLVLWLSPLRADAQTTGNCTAGQASVDLDIGGVRARLYNNGGLFWKGAGNVYNVPKVPAGFPVTPNALFTSGLWVGGYVGGELRQAAASFANWEFYPGPPLADGSGPSVCSHYDRIWVCRCRGRARLRADRRGHARPARMALCQRRPCARTATASPATTTSPAATARTCRATRSPSG